MMDRRTHDEVFKELLGQGVAKHDFAFVCPICATVQSLNSLKAAGADDELAEKYTGFSFEGRVTRAGSWPANPSAARKTIRGCDWTLGGLFQLHTLEVNAADGKVHPHFRPATPRQALILRAYVEQLLAAALP